MALELVPTPADPPTALAERLDAEFVALLERNRYPATPHPDRVYASQWRECERQMVYDVTQPASASPWSPELLAKFRYGRDRETAMIIDLLQSGRNASPPFRIVRQQERCTLRDRQGRDAITGKVDGWIEHDDLIIPFEIKNWSTYITDRITTFADVLDSPYTRSGAFQILVYMVAFGRPFGLLILDRSGLPKFVPVALTDENLDHVETFLAKAERVLDHAAAGTLPDFVEDASVCRRCPYFGHTCNPPLLAARPTVLTDPDLEAALERRETLKRAGKEFADLDADIKRRLRGVEHAFIGKFHIVGTWAKSSRVDLPPALKKQYTVSDPHGRFSLDIERLPEPTTTTEARTYATTDAD
jgi:hypothetical protein